MNFVDLVERVRQECAIGGDPVVSISGDLPGILPKVVNWVREEFLAIQNLPQPFNWMRAKVALPVSANVSDYPLDDAPWSRPDILAFDAKHADLIDGNSQFERIAQVPFDEFDRYWPVVQSLGKPGAFTLDPARHVVFNTIPQAAYTLRAWVTLTPQMLEDDADVPRMPAEHHMTIVHKAVMRYATHDGDQTLLQDHGLSYQEKLNALMMKTVAPISYQAKPLYRT